jgi:hypothetical protein
VEELQRHESILTRWRCSRKPSVSRHGQRCLHPHLGFLLYPAFLSESLQKCKLAGVPIGRVDTRRGHRQSSETTWGRRVAW